MPTKYTYEFVKEYVEKRGFELISKTYENCEQKLEMRCKNGHICFITFKKFKNRNTGCSDCCKNKKFKYKDVKEYIEEYNYKLLSTEYSNSTDKLHMLCDKGHNCYIPFKYFKNHNRRCMICCGSQKLTYEYIKEYIEYTKYKLLSKKYFRNSKKLKMICDKGHNCSISFNNFSRGRRCVVCSGHEKYKYEEVKEYIESENYTLSSTEYIRNKDNLDMICDKGHKCSISFHSFKNGNRRCGICKNKTEAVFYKWISEEFKYDIIKEFKTDWCINKSTNRNLPFDFCIEELKLIIEIDGRQHFQEVERFKGQTLDERIERDIYKIKKGLKNNYSILRIQQEHIYNIKQWDSLKILVKELIVKSSIPRLLCIGNIYLNIINNINYSDKYELSIII